METENKMSTGCALAGGTAGIAADMFFFPIETLKTYIQASQLSVKSAERLRKGKIYSGISCAFLVSFPNAAVFFLLYEFCSSYLLSKRGDNKSKGLEVMIFGGSAAIAEFAAATIRNPAEVVKQNMQLLSYGRVRESVKEIWTIRGLRGFYAGFMPLLFREIPFSFIQLPFFEFFQRFFQRFKWYCYSLVHLGIYRLCKAEEKVHLKTLLSGGLAGITSGFLTTPFDVIKTRMMTNTVKQYKIKPLQWLTKIIKEEGYLALLKGWHVRILYLGMGGMVYFGCYTTVLKLLGADKRYKQLRQ